MIKNSTAEKLLYTYVHNLTWKLPESSSFCPSQYFCKKSFTGLNKDYQWFSWNHITITICCG